MRVLLASQFYPPVIGGEERVVSSLADALHRRGHDVAVATLAGGDDAASTQGPVHVHRVAGISQRLGPLFTDPGRRHAPPFPDPGIVRGLRGVIARERPEVVHAHNWIVHSLLPALPADIPLVVTVHDYSLRCATKRLMLDGRECPGPALSRCLSCGMRHYGAAKGSVTVAGLSLSAGRLRRRTSMFLAISQAVADRNALGRGGSPTQIIPNFLPAPRDEPSDPELLAQLPDGGFIMFAGDLYPDKGVHVLLAAHASLGSEAPPLVMIGRRQPGLPIPAGQRVIAPGPWPHGTLMEAWRRCAVAVVPSVWPEPFGMVALEAMAQACPVVASRTGGLIDLVTHDESGILVTPGDVGELASALRQLLLDPERRKRLGANARRTAATFSEAEILPRIEAVYAGAIESGSRR